MLFGKTKAALATAISLNYVLKHENDILKHNREKLISENDALRKELDAAKHSVYKSVMGITADEFNEYAAALAAVYDEAHGRQKSKDAKPSEFMRGVSAAIELLKKYAVHDLV